MIYIYNFSFTILSYTHSYIHKIVLLKHFSYHGYSNLIGSDVHVRTDDGASSVVHSLPHHMFPEQTLFLLQELTQNKTREVTINLLYKKKPTV